MIVRRDVAPGAILGAVFAALLLGATDLQYGTEFAPGPGFAPLWLGILGVAASLALTVHALRARRAVPAADVETPVLPPDPEPAAEAPIGRSGDTRVVLAGLGIAGVALLTPFIGLVLAIAAFLLFLTLVIERLSPVIALASSLGTALVVHLVFARLLGVPFPVGPFGF